MAARFATAMRGLKATPSTCSRSKRALHVTSPHLVKAKSPASRVSPPARPVTRAKPKPSSATSQPLQRPTVKDQPSSLASDEKAPIDTIFQQRKWGFIGAGFAALGIGFYVTTVITSLAKTPCPACGAGACAHPASAGPGGGPATPTGRPPTLDAAKGEEVRQTAEAFDRGLDVPEFLGGIRGLRKEMGKWARGRVLEVAVGTGRNLGWYDWTEVVDGVIPVDEAEKVKMEKERERREEKRVRKVERMKKANKEEVDVEEAKMPGRFDGEMLSYTGVDISADMMGVARTRLRDTVPGLKKLMRRKRAEPIPESGVVVDVLDSRVRLCIADAEQPLPLPAPTTGAPPDTGAGKYDTIFQSFGLCSVSDPVKLVTNLASVLQPGTGRIYLLEHGRGWFDFLNGWMDKTAEGHFKKHGCWWNRDIEGIVREAEKTVPGLEVVHLGRPLLRQLGTTLVIELKVNPDAVARKTAQ
jgi:methyltransferase OMS1